MENKYTKTLITQFIKPILVVLFLKHVITKVHNKFRWNIAMYLPCKHMWCAGGKAQNFHALQQEVSFLTATFTVTCF